MKCALILLFLMLVDIGPIPVTAMICLYVLVVRPRWFRDFVGLIYGE